MRVLWPSVCAVIALVVAVIALVVAVAVGVHRHSQPPSDDEIEAWCGHRILQAILLDDVATLRRMERLERCSGHPYQYDRNGEWGIYYARHAPSLRGPLRFHVRLDKFWHDNYEQFPVDQWRGYGLAHFATILRLPNVLQHVLWQEPPTATDPPGGYRFRTSCRRTDKQYVMGCLQWAALLGYTDILRLLLDQERLRFDEEAPPVPFAQHVPWRSLQHTAVHGCSPLFYAAYTGHVAAAQYLMVAHGFRSRAMCSHAIPSARTTSPVAAAAMMGNLGQTPWSPLHVAAFYDNGAMIRAMADHDTLYSPYPPTGSARPRHNVPLPIFLAVQEGSLSAVVALHEADSTDTGVRCPCREPIRQCHHVFARAPNNKVTPLLAAVRHCRYDVAKYLLEHAGADANDLTFHGYAPLHYAAMGCGVDMAALLVRFQAYVGVWSNQEETPLDMAIDYCNAPVAEYLVGLGAKPVFTVNTTPACHTNPELLALRYPDQMYAVHPFNDPGPAALHRHLRMTRHRDERHEKGRQQRFYRSFGSTTTKRGH